MRVYYAAALVPENADVVVSQKPSGSPAPGLRRSPAAASTAMLAAQAAASAGDGGGATVTTAAPPRELGVLLTPARPMSTVTIAALSDARGAHEFSSPAAGKRRSPKLEPQRSMGTPTSMKRSSLLVVASPSAGSANVNLSCNAVAILPTTSTALTPQAAAVAGLQIYQQDRRSPSPSRFSSRATERNVITCTTPDSTADCDSLGAPISFGASIDSDGIVIPLLPSGTSSRPINGAFAGGANAVARTLSQRKESLENALNSRLANAVGGAPSGHQNGPTSTSTSSSIAPATTASAQPSASSSNAFANARAHSSEAEPTVLIDLSPPDGSESVSLHNILTAV